MSYRLLGLSKVPDTNPQEFVLFTKDNEDTQPGYVGRTDRGTEEVVREALALGGMSQAEIDIAFDRAKG